MSARESVRRLFESAIMNARAVISDMKTTRNVHQNRGWGKGGRGGTQQTRDQPQVWPCSKCDMGQQQKRENEEYTRTLASFAKENGCICSNHLCMSWLSDIVPAFHGPRPVPPTYLDVGIALHDFFDSREREWWVPIIWRFLFCSIDLSLPERT